MIQRAVDTDSFQRRKTVYKPVCKGFVAGMDLVDAGIHYEFYPCAESCYTGNVQRPAFVSVRPFLRLVEAFPIGCRYRLAL